MIVEDARLEKKGVDPRIARTRVAIRAAMQDLLHSKPFGQITIRDIVARADIGYNTFFRHYATKEEVLSDLADREIARLLDHCFPLLRADDTLQAALALCTQVEENSHLWSALLAGGASGAIRESFIAHTIARSADWPSAREWLPPEIGIRLVISMIVELFSIWQAQPDRYSARQIAEILDKFVISKLVGPEA